jgi:hypothetical protein
MGGSTRVPLFRQILAQSVGVLPVNTNLNTDDSAALGCVYYASGAKFSKNRLDSVYDVPYHPLFVSFSRGSDDFRSFDETDYITANNGHVPAIPIFAGKWQYERERSFSFPASSDFSVSLLASPHSRGSVATYRIAGISELAGTIANRVASNVTVTFATDSRGMVILRRAQLTTRYLARESGRFIGSFM